MMIKLTLMKDKAIELLSVESHFVKVYKSI